MKAVETFNWPPPLLWKETELRGLSIKSAAVESRSALPVFIDFLYLIFVFSGQRMKNLEIIFSRDFNAEIDRMRMECFPGSYPAGTGKDRFDDRAVHVGVYIEKRLGAYIRMIPGPDGYFVHTRRSREVPHGIDVIDLSRAMVAAEFRGLALFELVIVNGLNWAFENNFAVALGGSRPDRKFKQMLHELGFTDWGGPMECYFDNDTNYIGQLIAADLTSDNRKKWIKRLAEIERSLSARGFNLTAKDNTKSREKRYKTC